LVARIIAPAARRLQPLRQVARCDSSRQEGTMAKESKEQQAVVGRVMREFKQGKLKSSSGDKVKNPKQAIAIGLSEAGASDRAAPERNERNLARTRRAGGSRAELYAEARRRGVAGRSKMSKAELEQALG
jgi:hypothetical protein